MPEFILAYHGGKKPDSPEQGAAHMEKWKVWLEELGDKGVNPGTPLGASKMVSSDGVSDEGGSHAISGFSVVAADSMEEALEMAKSCPFVDKDTVDGVLEVAQIMKMQ